MAAMRDFKGWSNREGSAVTTLLVASISITALYFFSCRYEGAEYVGYHGVGASRPWTLVTYPWSQLILSGVSILGFIFLMIWFYSIGRAVERDVNSKKFAVIWVVATLVGALSNWAGSYLAKGFWPLTGPALPIAAISIIWCTRNPSAEMRVYMVIPITGKWLGFIIVGLVLLGFGRDAPLVGILDCVPVALAFAYASNRLPGLAYGAGGVYKAKQKEATTRGQVMYDQSYFDDVKRREIEREERERLKKLLGED